MYWEGERLEKLDKVIERLEYCAETRDGFVQSCVNDAIELLKEQPKIVRCMNCKWNSGTASYPYCQWFSESKPPIWFCANGELKE